MQYQKILFALLALLLFSSCGGESSNDAADNCEIELSFSSQTQSNAENDSYNLIYMAEVPELCKYMLGNKSGGVRILFKSVARPSQGKLTELYLGTDRKLTQNDFASSDTFANNFTDGSIQIEKAYLPGDLSTSSSGTNAYQKWFLPWGELPLKFSAVYSMPLPNNNEQFPVKSSLILEYVPYE